MPSQDTTENPAAAPGFTYLAEAARERLPYLLAALARHGLKPVVGAELEFYLRGLQRERFPVILLEKLDSALREHGFRVSPIQRERGHEQAEFLLPPSDVQSLLAQLERLPWEISAAASMLGMAADFAAKPSPEDYGSGLHLHLHLERGGRRVPWSCVDGAPDGMLARCLAGLLHLMPAMPALLFAHDGFARMQPEFDAPHAASWGLNNRSVALRLIDKGKGLHMEFRLPGADCPPALAMLALFAGIAEGLEKPHHLPPICYGREEKGRTALPRTQVDARQAYVACGAMQAWAGEEVTRLVLGEGG